MIVLCIVSELKMCDDDDDNDDLMRSTNCICNNYSTIHNLLNCNAYPVSFLTELSLWCEWQSEQAIFVNLLIALFARLLLFVIIIFFYLSHAWWIRHALWVTCQNQHHVHNYNPTTYHTHTHILSITNLSTAMKSPFLSFVYRTFSIDQFDYMDTHSCMHIVSRYGWKHTSTHYTTLQPMQQSLSLCVYSEWESDPSLTILFLQWYAIALTNSFH